MSDENGVVKLVKIVLYVSIYMMVGPSLILVNKYILKDLEFVSTCNHERA
jgi:hypothetical protein